MFNFNKNKNIKYFCQECEHLKPALKFIGNRFCFHCFKNTISNIRVNISETLTIRDSLKFKKKSQGIRKFSFKGVIGCFSSKSYKNGVDLYRLLDKEKDEYHEVVKNFKTGKIVHENHEKLSEHIGHGSDKNNL